MKYTVLRSYRYESHNDGAAGLFDSEQDAIKFMLAWISEDGYTPNDEGLIEQFSDVTYAVIPINTAASEGFIK